MGIPAAHVCSITSISKSVGANRIVPAISIPHPLGNPEEDSEGEYELRRELVENALKAVSTEVSETVVFG